MNPPLGSTIFELSRRGANGTMPPEAGVPGVTQDWRLPSEFLRKSPPSLPEVAEPEVVRHYLRLSTMNHHVDKDTYPLGSCTMKYNPKINERAASLPGFARLHPETPDAECQGALRLMWELAHDLAEITGMDHVGLQPSAGAQGEMTGLLIAKAWFRERKENRPLILIPDSAHGTNPASVNLAGFQAVPVKSNEQGLVDPEALASVLNESVACIMLTNPNTLGLFERDITRITEMVHAKGGLTYNDGANTNALLGLSRAGDMGFDILHLNLHKTFSTPHGGGGPGAAAVGVKSHLRPFLPGAEIERTGSDDAPVFHRRPPGALSIGSVHPFAGNFGVLVRAYTYIRLLGAAGLKRVAEDAIINANYLRARIEGAYEIPHAGPCMHEFVASASRQKALGVRAGQIAKRLLDFGVHSPTVYFPLIVPEALMIEPTETESKERLDTYAEALLQIAREVETDPELVQTSPHTTPIGKVDEARAARDLDVCYPY